jgi:hypothetical protein
MSRRTYLASRFGLKQYLAAAFRKRQRVTDLYPISPPKTERAQTVLPSCDCSLQR